jgi:acetate kinase
MNILVVNCGSSSIKYQLFQMPERHVLARGVIERIGEAESAHSVTVDGKTSRTSVRVSSHEEGMQLIGKTLGDEGQRSVARIDEIGAVGHRVVHGGEEFTGSVLIDDQVIESIERVADLAPLHNPPNLVGIRAARQTLPAIPHVACFDTAFHTTIPRVAYTYALPYRLYAEHGIRRYGFHGSSHRYVASRAAELVNRAPDQLNCITCHLGNGCSMAAVRAGKCVDTSMGLTPLEGLVMGTRSGDIDPAIIFFLADKGHDLSAINDLCNKQSGLLGVSETSNDMRTLAQQSAKGNDQAQLAIDIFCYRVKKYLGAYTAVLGRLDAVVFTGGIGENSPAIRAACCDQLGQLGIEVDSSRNENIIGTEGEIQTASSRVQVLVIPTDEEGVIAADTFELTRVMV